MGDGSLTNIINCTNFASLKVWSARGSAVCELGTVCSSIASFPGLRPDATAAPVQLFSEPKVSN